MKRTRLRLGSYPRRLALKAGREVTIRPLQPSDRQELLRFFRSIPAPDRALLHHDVTDPALVRRWAAHADYFRALPLVAESKGRIVGDGVLIRGLGQARAHTALARVLVATRFRNTGLVEALLAALCEVADGADLSPVFVEVVPGRDEELARAARRQGFRKVASIPGGVRVTPGGPRDVVLLGRQS
jgi:predicted N-acetyltransferase YhbS